MFSNKELTENSAIKSRILSRIFVSTLVNAPNMWALRIEVKFDFRIDTKNPANIDLR